MYGPETTWGSTVPGVSLYHDSPAQPEQMAQIPAKWANVHQPTWAQVNTSPQSSAVWPSTPSVQTHPSFSGFLVVTFLQHLDLFLVKDRKRMKLLLLALHICATEEHKEFACIFTYSVCMFMSLPVPAELPATNRPTIKGTFASATALWNL